MPPKVKSAERVKQEAEAQRARAAALTYLAKTGAGPSQKEVAQQQKEREKWANATTQAVQQRLAHLLPAAQAPSGHPMRDNTLEAMAVQRARAMYQGGGARGGAVEARREQGAFAGQGQAGEMRAAAARASDALPDGWKETLDPASGGTYYWNEVTKATSWDRPRHQTVDAADSKETIGGDETEVLEDGWEEVEDPQSGQSYFWHRDSNETTWTKPVKKTVSLQKAREAKSKLDEILKFCGPAGGAKASSNSTTQHRGTGVEESAIRSAMKHTARVYSGLTGGAPSTSSDSDAPPTYNGNESGRPGSVKKLKQQRKAKDTLLARQTAISTLVGKLEDRDTQQQALTSLLEMMPSLDSALVNDLYNRVEKNKNPARSSTRRMFVLLLAALCKYHPAVAARLLPRMLAYVSLRLRDKEVQITDACAILSSAITLYVLPLTCVNAKGSLSPRRRQPSDPDNGAVTANDDLSQSTANQYLKPFENFVAHLSCETNAVGEHATKCMSSIVRPVEFDGSTPPSTEVMRLHGARIAPFLRIFVPSLVAKMNESTQYANFSPSFLLLHAVVMLAKTLKLDCRNRSVFDVLLSHVGNLVDAIEDVFRDGPREDWVMRKRAIELLVLLVDLFALGDTAEDGPGRQYFGDHIERIRRLVMEARHDPISAVRDAALPAVFLFDKLQKLFPRPGEVTTPPSPFKRVFTARGASCGPMRPFSSGDAGDRSRKSGDRQRAEGVDNEREDDEGLAGDKGEADEETDFAAGLGDESATPNDEVEEENQPGKRTPSTVPALRLPTSVVTGGTQVEESKRVVATNPSKMNRKKVMRIPRIAAPKSPPLKREVVLFHPPSEDEDAFPEDQGDEQVGQSVDVDETIAQPQQSEEAAPTNIVGATAKDNDEDLPSLTRREAAILAATEREADLALRLCFLEDDASLLQKVLALIGEPCMQSLSRASRTALCAAFLEFLDLRDYGSSDDCDTDELWLALAWLRDLSHHSRLVEQLDSRVARALDVRLNGIAEQPTKAGLVAADIATRMAF